MKLTITDKFVFYVLMAGLFGLAIAMYLDITRNF